VCTLPLSSSIFQATVPINGASVSPLMPCILFVVALSVVTKLPIELVMDILAQLSMRIWNESESKQR